MSTAQWLEQIGQPAAWPWAQIRAGWEVSTPRGWLTVERTVRDGDHQVITFVGGAQTRQPVDRKVLVRTLLSGDVPWETLLDGFPDMEILEDES